MGNLLSDEPLTSSVSMSEENDVIAQPVPSRQKIDLQKLRDNMDSFRKLSTLSVDKALASHAFRMERDGFMSRFAFAAILFTMTLIIGIANAKGVTDSPMLTWVTLTSAIAILSEVYRRYIAIKVHARNRLSCYFRLMNRTGHLSCRSTRWLQPFLVPTLRQLPTWTMTSRSRRNVSRLRLPQVTNDIHSWILRLPGQSNTDFRPLCCVDHHSPSMPFQIAFSAKQR